jgi:3,4-dihydroxy 2-butanone 4-phosphate synthase / GTP cyclohydrolase II
MTQQEQHQQHMRPVPASAVTASVPAARSLSSVISLEAETTVPTKHGDFRFLVFRSGTDRDDHVALIRGDRDQLVRASREEGSGVLAILHVSCMASEVFGSTACECALELDRALEIIAREPMGGIMIYLRREEGRASVANNLLRVLGVERVRLLCSGERCFFVRKR